MLQFLDEYFNVSGFITVTCIFVALFYLFTYVKKTKRLPPGPIGLPVVGYLPFLTKTPHLKLMKLAFKYGNVFSMKIGSNLYVVLNQGKVIREAFSKPELLGRPPNSFGYLIKNFESPFFSNGRVWQGQRQFALHTMIALGLGKSSMEERILEEIQYFLGVIRKSNGLPLEIKETLTPGMSNNICSLVFGHRYKYGDPRRTFLDKSLDIISRSFQLLTIDPVFPWLMKLPFGRKIFQVDLLSKTIEEIMTFIRERIDEHEKTLDPDNVRDYIDGYLIEMKKRQQENPETFFSRNMLTGSVANFFAAGSDTVRITVTWCLYTMAGFQDVQKKVQAEIDEVIGKERTPSWQDHKDMPFTQAIMAEVQRWKTVAPFGLVRYTLDDTEIEGYFIPKGTSVISNLWFAHHDPEEWERPDEFVPNRFLSKDGKSFIKPKCYMPFSTGKRSCPGEVLALIEVFLYFTSVLQKFTVEVPEGSTLDFEGISAITYSPKPHMLCFKCRS